VSDNFIKKNLIVVAIIINIIISFENFLIILVSVNKGY